MAKILIIDSNDERRKTMTAKLRSKSQVVSAMSMINIANITSIVSSCDAMVLLDQEDYIARAVLNTNTSQQLKILLTNSVFANEHAGNENIIFIERDDVDTWVVNQLEALFLSHPKVQPIAEDPQSKATLEMALRVAKTNATVLITGETGTGKEVLAQYIHHHSAFATGPFISVNCAALPENMMEAVLFGYEKGAFTSAVNSYVGKFEQAHNGTLLLDEVSEISVGLQAKLLRALQEREIERIGGKKVIKINVRIIAATNCDLQQQVEAGAFRKDLFYRLNVLPIHCVALRDRQLDIIPIAEFLIQYHAQLLNCKALPLSASAKIKLINYSWPGNIREMDNIIQRALILTDGKSINENNIDVADAGKNPVDIHQFESRLEANEAQVILEILTEADGCRNTAARKLNISPRTLRYKIAKLRAIGVKVP